jgi:site-specific DNA-cytosine methylase
MKVAVICEYSGTVRDAFTREGHEAISFDILPSESPGEHYQGDIMALPLEYWEQFDLAVCHPPCTHLAVSGARHFKKKLEENPNIQKDALDFVRYLMNLPIERIAIENPVSIISSQIRKPDQIIQPWQFGDPFQKTTCLWLKNLPKLVPTDIVDKGEFVTFPSGKKMAKWFSSNKSGKARAKTFDGIANAMANQWGQTGIN